MRRDVSERGFVFFDDLVLFFDSAGCGVVAGRHYYPAGVIEIGTLSVFMSYALGLMEPVQWIVRAVSDLITVQVNVERFTRLMETESDVRDTPEVVARYGDSFEPLRKNWEPLHGDITFEDVSFKYPDGDEYVLEHFDLHVPQGTNVAIVGETGAGKSTLLKALELGVYDHIAGDGRELVITDSSAVKSRAEDGRSIRNVDISMFIGNLPNGKDTVFLPYGGRQRKHFPGRGGHRRHGGGSQAVPHRRGHLCHQLYDPRQADAAGGGS